MAQMFGGPWTILKLEVIGDYLRAFNTALKKTSFERIYIDAFAGSGDFRIEAADAPLLDNEERTDVHAGSVRRALSVDPQFHKLYLIETEPENVKALRRLAEADKSRRAIIRHGDANSEIARICEDTNWRKTRGVLFLDPFGHEVEWATLQHIARTTKLDIWYLFPLSGVYRNAPIDKHKLTADKRAAISRILGTPDWEAAFYSAVPHAQSNLFAVPEEAAHRTINVDGIEAFVKSRLETVFPVVLGPKRLLGPRRAPLFSLFFAMSNESEKAAALARRILRRL